MNQPADADPLVLAPAATGGLKVRVARQTGRVQEESLLVPYRGSCPAVQEALARLGAPAVASANPYWGRVDITVADPDGFRVVLGADGWQPDPANP